MTDDSANSEQDELPKHLEATRFIGRSARNLDENEAAQLTDAELIEMAREVGDRDKINGLVGAVELDISGLVPESERSGVLPHDSPNEIPCSTWNDCQSHMALLHNFSFSPQRFWHGQGDSA